MVKNNFQFDKQALEKFLIRKGIDVFPEIEFCNRIFLANGFYKPSENKICIFLKPITPRGIVLFCKKIIFPNKKDKFDEEFLAKILAHELGHSFEKKTLKPFWICLEILSVVFLLLAILLGFLKILDVSFWPMFFAFLPLLYLSYKFHPAEIRARKFSKDHWREVFAFLFSD